MVSIERINCLITISFYVYDIISDAVPTADPNLTVAMISEELPALTVTTIVGMTVVMLIAILAVFILGVLIDCRQQ